jgi:hypothetical protein
MRSRSVHAPGIPDRDRRQGGVGVPRDRESDRLLVATLRLRLPNRSWLAPFSQRHLDLSLEILGRSEIDVRTLVADVWISGGPAGAWSREIARYPDVERAVCLAEVGNGFLYRIRFRAPPIVALYRRLEVPLPFPLRLRGGYVHWEAVARASAFFEILAFARAADPELKIKWTRKPPLLDHLPRLTAGQRELLHRAIEAGYFAVPRRVSLTDLARDLDRSKSSVSQALALIEQRLLESTLRSDSLRA